MCDATFYALSSILKYHVSGVRMIGKLAFNNNTKTAKLKQYIRTMFPVNMYCLAVGGYAVTRNENGELYIDRLFTVSIFAHARIISRIA